MGTRNLRRLFVCVTAALFLAAGALPASADTVGTSTATVTVQGGVLSITVNSYAGNLGTLFGAAGGPVSGALGQVQVDDARAAPAGSTWVASVISTPFSSPYGTAIPASAVSYTAGPIGQVGIATYTPNNPSDLSNAVAAVTATGISGNNVATWNPTITVVLPTGTVVGVYSASITHSVV